MKVGPSRHSRGGIIEWSHYVETGETSIRVFDDVTHEPEYTATICPPKGSRLADPNQVWLKGWGENEGVPIALQMAGVVHLLDIWCRCGSSIAILGELTPEARAELDATYLNDPDAAAAREKSRLGRAKKDA